MKLFEGAVARFFDALALVAVFLFQTVVLNMLLITDLKGSSYPYLWFLADFLTLSTFFFTLYRAFSAETKAGPSTASTSSIHTSHSANNKVLSKPVLQPSYFSWLLYSVLLIAKIITLFKFEIPQSLKHSDFLGPQMLKFCIGLSAIVFSLLAETHKYTDRDETKNSYATSIAYGVALDILDSASFLSLLIGSESGLIYPFEFENFILGLAAINLMLPALCLYKLSVPHFPGNETDEFVIFDVVYRIFHIVVVNGAYFGVRIYLWSILHTDTSIFIIKNIYSIWMFIRVIPKDLKILRPYLTKYLNRKDDENGDIQMTEARRSRSSSPPNHQAPLIPVETSTPPDQYPVIPDRVPVLYSQVSPSQKPTRHPNGMPILLPELPVDAYNLRSRPPRTPDGLSPLVGHVVVMSAPDSTT